MKFLFVIIIFLSSLSLFAQSDEDTLITEKKIDKKIEMTKSPMGAVWRTMIFPGVGQIYVESYWKAPIFAIGAGTLLYFIFDNHIQFSDFQNQIESMNESDPDYFLIQNQRDFYLDNRDRSILFLAGVYLLASIDAYVGAHLYDFEVDDDISFYLSPNRNQIIGLGIKVKF